MENINKILNYLKRNDIQYLATLGLDKRAKVRPVQFMLEQEGKLWFCTGTKKEMYKELMANNEVELTVAEENSWLRLSAKAHIEDNKYIKRQILEKSKLVKSIYKNEENPEFISFYLEIVQGMIYSFTESGATKMEF